MKTIKFWKMSGSGNDFVVVDNRRGTFPKNVAKAAQKLCFRQEGIGADGLLLLEPSQKADFRMVYFNSDGSRATMCGNGARCISWFAYQQGVVKSIFSFESDAGLIHGKIEGGHIQVQLRDAGHYHPRMHVKALGKIYEVSFLNIGVPHAVIQVPNLTRVDVEHVGRALRFQKAFGPKGTNVNFVQRVHAHALKVRTYERGVENETLACGTGVCASAIAMVLRGKIQTPVRCRVRSGDVLNVDFVPHPENAACPATQVSLRGPVRVTFKGEINI